MTEPLSPTTPPASEAEAPPWRPPRDAGGNLASLALGLILIAVGAWYFLDHTLGLDMPRIDWEDAWPVIIIVIGAVVVVRSVGKRA